MPDGLPDYYPQQLEALRAIARAAQALAADIRSWFPVEGAAWTLEGSPSDGGAVGIVAYSAARLDRLLYPLRLCFDASIYDYVCFLNPENPPEQWPKRLHPRQIRAMKKRPFRVSDTAVRYAFGAFAGGPREVEAHCRQALPVSQDFHAAVLAVMASHDRLLGHYGWGAWVGNDAAKDKRAWP